MDGTRISAASFLIAAVTALFVAPAGAATVPYSNDFSSNVSEFVETTDARWTLNTAAGLYNNTGTVGDQVSTALVQMTDLGNETDRNFVISTQFSITSFTGPDTTVGFAALSSTNDASGAYYLADVQVGSDDLRLFRISANSNLAEEPAGFDIQTGTPYSLTLEGTYAGTGDLTLVLTLTDIGTPTNTKTISATVADANVLQGQYFGFRDRPTGSTGDLNVNFDSLSIVPEPSSLALLALPMLALARHRRT